MKRHNFIHFLLGFFYPDLKGEPYRVRGHFIFHTIRVSPPHLFLVFALPALIPAVSIFFYFLPISSSHLFCLPHVPFPHLHSMLHLNFSTSFWFQPSTHAWFFFTFLGYQRSKLYAKQKQISHHIAEPYCPWWLLAKDPILECSSLSVGIFFSSRYLLYFWLHLWMKVRKKWTNIIYNTKKCYQ